MGDNVSGWHGFTGQDLHRQPPEVQQRVEAWRRRTSAAEVRVRLFGVAPGQAEVQVRVDPDGELAAAAEAGTAGESVRAQLLEALVREMRTAITLLYGDLPPVEAQ